MDDMVATNQVLGPQVWAEQWAVDASVKADSIESRLNQALAAPTPDSRAQATAAAIRTLLQRSRTATTRTRSRRTLLDGWRGTSVVQAYQSLHAAEVLLLDVLPDADVEALVPHISARACEVLEPDDPRRTVLASLQQMEPATRRAYLRTTLALIYDGADQAYVRVRDFRNVLYISAGLIALLMAAMCLALLAWPAALPFCFTPEATAPTADATGSQVCPSGLPQPSSADVWILAGLGLLGGSLAAAFSIRHLRGTSLPYDIPIALALLKVPSGSLTAVAGILLLGGGFVPGLSELDTQRQILAYALVFGYAQQVATRLVDERAQQILDSVPAKPEPASAATPAPRPRRGATRRPAPAPTLPQIPPPQPIPER